MRDKMLAAIDFFGGINQADGSCSDCYQYDGKHTPECEVGQHLATLQAALVWLADSRQRATEDARQLALVKEEVAKLRADAERLEWVLPMVVGDDSDETTAKTIRLVGALMLGNDGRAAIDKARGAP